jgi:arylsulfatase A-like enzyme
VFGGNILNIESGGASEATQHEERAQYYASVSAIDEAVGRIMDELETNGLLENTLVIYTSDHGLCLGHRGIWGKGNATAPQNMIEESIRIPMILSAPGRIPVGQRRREFSDHLDLFQTVLDAAKVARPTGNHAGSGLLDLCAGDNAEWRDVQFCEYGTARMIRTATHKFIKRYDNRPDELFDLTSADGEGRNILLDSTSASIAATLSKQLDAYFERLGCAAPEQAEFTGKQRFNVAEAWR